MYSALETGVCSFSTNFPLAEAHVLFLRATAQRNKLTGLDNLIWVNAYVVSKNLLRTYYGFTSHRHQEHEVWNLTDLSANSQVVTHYCVTLSKLFNLSEFKSHICTLLRAIICLLGL